jgi:hypothetical protein
MVAGTFPFNRFNMGDPFGLLHAVAVGDVYPYLAKDPASTYQQDGKPGETSKPL